jgi:hypothetical protein
MSNSMRHDILKPRHDGVLTRQDATLIDATKQGFGKGIVFLIIKGTITLLWAMQDSSYEQGDLTYHSNDGAPLVELRTRIESSLLHFV